MKIFFHLIHQKIPQLSLHYSTASKNHENEIVSQSSYEENSESDQNFSDESEWNEKRNTQYAQMILKKITKNFQPDLKRLKSMHQRFLHNMFFLKS